MCPQHLTEWQTGFGVPTMSRWRAAISTTSRNWQAPTFLPLDQFSCHWQQVKGADSCSCWRSWKTKICWFCLDFCTRERITIFGNVRALSVDKKVTNSEVFFANNVSNLCSSSIKSHVFWRRPLQRGEWQSCQSKAFLSFHTSCLSKGNLKYSKQLAVLSEALLSIRYSWSHFCKSWKKSTLGYSFKGLHS